MAAHIRSSNLDSTIIQKIKPILGFRGIHRNTPGIPRGPHFSLGFPGNPEPITEIVSLPRTDFSKILTNFSDLLQRLHVHRKERKRDMG